MTKALKILFNIGLVLFLIAVFSAEARAEVGVPKIIKLTAQDFFSLTGTAPANNEVSIYLDGNFVGRAEAKSLTKPAAAEDCAGPAREAAACQASWQFQSNLTQKLADGTHAVIAIAQDKTSLTLSAPANEIKFTVNAMPAPTLIAPNERTATANLKPLITGLTQDDSRVKIFIDGVYDGETGVLKNDSGTANFAYQPALNLNRGWHKIQARAVSGEQSSPESNVLNFQIELPMPAPIIFKPVVNRDTSSSRPFIVGLAKNDSKIKIYIDKKYQGELTVKNHPSGTANFAFKPARALARGAHSVYTVAADKRGKESSLSNPVNFSIKSYAIAQSAQEERKQAVVKIKEPTKPAEIKSEPVVISQSSGSVLKKLEAEPAVPIQKPAAVEQKLGSVDVNPLAEKEKAIKQELKDKEKIALEKVKSLIGASAAETKSDRGMINEGKQNQSRLKLSLVIFILFLVGVVAWLLWVNRELVKERRAQAEAEETKNNPPNKGSSSPTGGQDNKLF